MIELGTSLLNHCLINLRTSAFRRRTWQVQGDSPSIVQMSFISFICQAFLLLRRRRRRRRVHNEHSFISFSSNTRCQK